MGTSKIAYLNDLRIYPARAGSLLRSKKDIINHLLIDYTIASIATYAFCSSYELIKTLLKSLEEKYSIERLFNSNEKELILDIYNKNLDMFDLEDITYRFEKCNIYLWALGFIDNVFYDEKCSVKEINNILLKCNNYDELASKASLRDIVTIEEYFNTLYKAKYTIEDSLSMRIAFHQMEALNYILFFNPNRDNVKVMIERNDLRFELMIPSNLEFVPLGEGTTELLALINYSSTIKMGIIDFKNMNIQDNVRMYAKRGFDIADVSSINSVYLDRKIVKVNFVKDKLSINTYYMIINDHLIRVDSLDNPKGIDMDVILSIKMF